MLSIRPLLHVCCAPCLATALESIRQCPSGPIPDISGVIFYNPNIHPLIEFRRRVKGLRLYLEREPLAAEIDDEYGIRIFLDRVWSGLSSGSDRRERCFRCYLLRLGRTAELAAAKGEKAFSTTLLASREQDRDLVADAGREVARKHGVEFVTADLRSHLPEEKKLRGIYKQQYCGCIFSEEERFRNTGKHLYRPGVDDGGGKV